MSQQEFAPGPQSEKPENEEEIYKPHYPYSWSGNADPKAAPRDEPPSTYEYNPDAMIQGYQAQDVADQQQQQAGANPYEYQPPAQEQLPPPYQYNPYSDDAANTYEQGYNPYNNNAQVTPGPGFNPYTNTQNNQGQVPHWARPQPNQPRGFRFGWIILALIFISMSSGAMRFFFWDFGHSFGFIFLPIIALMIVATVISRALWGGNRRGGRRRGGPWGW
ncbi:MAG TPA: hypothetical protein VFQ36_09240 [Ktedonobacteraceae bacterium]|nr:hypothetical protein [Ktedonobacteraceae bacterium]